MNPNPYLVNYSQSDVESLTTSGSIQPDIDSYANLVIEQSDSSMYSSSITIPLQNVPCDSIKVETQYDVTFTEL